MYLKEVIINGFKSFADRTKVSLDKGITCVVGPNGCGKSNIVESVRWVLGEQRAKSLRSSKMQDVIFQGTDRRKQLNQCEVSLIFTDCEAELGTNFNEVEITRRVTRDGGGDYYINGKACRLKDIHRLFMDTGIGHASYSFMMQGQIDQILSSNPAERRTIFEEAAGITKYKAQRKEALNKLALVDQNLARVTDRVEELSRQIGSLKRQASKALRYKRFKHRLTHLDLAYNSYFYSKRHAAIQELEERSGNLKKIVDDTQGDLSEREAALERRKEERGEVYNALQTSQQTVFNLRSEKENADNQVEFATIRQQDIEERLEEIGKEVITLEEQLQELSSKAENTAQHKEQALAMVDSSDDVFKQKNSAFELILQELAQLEGEFAQHKQSLLVAEGSITRLRSQCTSCEVDLKSFQVKHAGFSDTIYELNEERILLQQKHTDIVKTMEVRQRELDQAQGRVDAAKEDSVRLRGQFKDLQGEIQVQDREVARLSAQLSTLAALQAKFEGFSEGAKAILQGRLADILPDGSFRPFSKLLNPDPEYLPVLETLFGTAGDAITIDDRSKVPEVVSTLDSQKLGRACLQVAVPAVAYSVPSDLPDWLRPAASIADVSDNLAPVVDAFLAGCYFCESLDAFLNFWQERPDFEFFMVATLHGELIDRKGLIYGGRKLSHKKESSFIQREKQIKQLKVQIAEDNEKLTQLSEKALQLQAAMDASEVEVEERRKRQVEIGQELSSLRGEEKSAQSALAQNEQTIAKSQRQLEELEQRRSEAEERLQQAEVEMREAEERVAANRQLIVDTEERIAQLRIERDAHKDGLAEVRLDLAEKKQRLEMLDRGLLETESQRQDLQTRIVRRRQEMDSLHEQTAELDESKEANREKSVEVERTLEVTMQSLEKSKSTLNELEQQITDAEAHLTECRHAQRERESSLNASEVKLAEERSQANFLAEKVRTEYETEIDTIDWKEQLWKADEPFEVKVKLDDLDEEAGIQAKPKHERGDPTEEDLAAMDETDWNGVNDEVKQLRSRINSLGAVNLVAIEEYAELKERYDFLSSQSEDLWNSKEELLKAIDEINETSQKMFKETFDQIRKNFVYTFEKLFGGGKADLELIEAEDILDSGIEITARPPGTKLKSLSLLSGGQRTMTAVGLLFAIYMVKPSPFCVLDELDAPLDDANIGRFCDMLKQFTNYSQFLVVTHNKRTVGAADSIYGVTMQERGVTKLISMRFNPKTADTEEVDAAAMV